MQVVLSMSSVEPEYRATTDLIFELARKCNILIGMCLIPKTPIRLYCSNRSAIYITQNLIFYERTKHIEVDYHIVQGKV